MKMVLAFVPPYKLDAVRRSLEGIPGFPGMTIADAQGFGREKVEEASIGDAQLTDFVPASRIETVVHDGLVDAVVAAIVAAAHTGRHGDGKIFVLPVENAHRVRTGESGEAAV